MKQWSSDDDNSEVDSKISQIGDHKSLYKVDIIPSCHYRNLGFILVPKETKDLNRTTRSPLSKIQSSAHWKDPSGAMFPVSLPENADDDVQ